MEERAPSCALLVELFWIGQKFLWFLETIKDTFFIFAKSFIEQCTHHFVLLPSAIFLGNFRISSSQNFLPFWAKSCSRCLLKSSRELNFFPLREFYKDPNKWTSEDTESGECGRWIRTSQPSCDSFYLVIKTLRGKSSQAATTKTGKFDLKQNVKILCNKRLNQ